MPPIAIGAPAPPVPGVDFRAASPAALFFYKVTCPVCQLAAPKIQSFERGYPGRISGVGQDPPATLAEFNREFGITFAAQEDAPPYSISRAYDIEVVPTMVLVHDGVVAAVVESWDRDGLNELSRQLADLTSSGYTPISDPSDGLPVFRPG